MVHGVLMVFQLDFKGPYHNITMCLGNTMVAYDWDGFISAFWSLFSVKC